MQHPNAESVAGPTVDLRRWLFVPQPRALFFSPHRPKTDCIRLLRNEPRAFATELACLPSLLAYPSRASHVSSCAATNATWHLIFSQRFRALGWEQRSAMDDIGVLRAKVPHAKLFSANFFASGPAASPTCQMMQFSFGPSKANSAACVSFVPGHGSCAKTI